MPQSDDPLYNSVFDGKIDPEPGWPDVPSYGDAGRLRGGPDGEGNANAGLVALTKRVNQLLQNQATMLGYMAPASFEAGLSVQTDRFSLVYGGELYAPSADAIPFTTGSAFNPAQWVPLRQDVEQQGIVLADKVITGFDASGLRHNAWVHFGGRDTVGDGGGGPFRYSTSSTQPADGIFVFAPAGGGRLFREGWTVFGFNGDIIVKWAGAKGDGTPNDAPAIQSAINAASARGAALYFHPGVYAHTDTLVWKNGAKYYGPNINASNSLGAVLVYTGSADANAINNPINSSTFASIQFEDLTFLCNSLGSGKALFYDTGSTYLYFDRCKFNFAGVGSFGLVLHQTEIATVSKCIFEVTGNIGLGALIRLADGPVLKHPTAVHGYTNRITIRDTQINPALGGAQAIGIWDDGGLVHKYTDNNLNGGSISIYLLKPISVAIEGNEIEGYTTAGISCGLADAGLTGLRIVNNYMLAVPPALSFANNSFAELTYTDNVISVLGGGPCETNISGSPNAKIFAANNREISAGDSPFNNYLQPNVDTVGAMFIAGSSTAGTQLYSQNTMTWRTVGDLCFFNVYIALTGKDPATAGDIRLTGLPFPARLASAQITAVSISFLSDITLSAGCTQLTGIIRPGNNFVELAQGGSGQPAAFLPATGIANTSQIMVSGVYPI